MWFKIWISAALFALLLHSCSPLKHSVKTAKTEKIELKATDQDSTEYDLIIMDSGFQSWFDANHRPIWYYSKDYLATWNYQYVIAWNAKVRSPSMQNRPDNPFIQEIDYLPNIDYGIELNYKLYYYFKYIEDTWGRILPYERRN